jgi:hypothetical protein
MMRRVLVVTAISALYLILSAWLIGYKTDRLFRIHRVLDPFRFHEGLS